MSLTVELLLQNADLHEAIRDQSKALLEINAVAPKLAAVFGTQQRWLLAHLAMSIYFNEAARGAPEPAIVMARFFEQVKSHSISSVNTADAFVKEMLVYGIAEQIATADKRNRPVRPAAQTVAAVGQWMWIHLATLDRLDGGHRQAAYKDDPTLINRLHPEITANFLVSPEIRTPPQTFTLFTWLNNGGIVMDWLLAGIEPADASVERVATQVRSVPQMAETFRLSRTHLTRKLREAEAIGSIGWEGTRGRSVMWVSKEFRREYAESQSAKLAIIDAACETFGIR
ncbi:hypothetical protein PDO_0708 [Rhizobium sp. PDO1-076]|uniref:hypothetical protein n=1 Tax=Rhizobium sp. PDO1-076 TaxID=1125979 RepID=UPI00024E3670|nr:hypothetical protein [Rhizobium sp. PDO1-076]EHS48952.1 hypothetical protein PDO_0708 [Rhizobium sp. PDO1-076]